MLQFVVPYCCRGAVERLEAARDIEGCPLSVQSMEPHKAPGITRGAATKGGSVAATRGLYRARSCIESMPVLLWGARTCIAIARWVCLSPSKRECRQRRPRASSSKEEQPPSWRNRLRRSSCFTEKSRGAAGILHDGVACGSTNFFSALYNIYCWGVRPLPMPPRKLPVPRAPPHPHPSCVLCCLSQLPEGTGAKVPPKRRRSSHMRPCCYYLRFTGTWVVSVRLLTFFHVSFYFSVPACLFMEISCLCCIDHGTTDQFSSDLVWTRPWPSWVTTFIWDGRMSSLFCSVSGLVMSYIFIINTCFTCLDPV